MEKSKLKGRILEDLKSLISKSCRKGSKSVNFRTLHQLLLKKHYNASDVSIDYHRKRITLEVVMDDELYEPGKVNLNLPTLRTNLLFGNLKQFLHSCIDTDRKSLAFYAWLLRTYTQKEVPLAAV